MEPRYRMATPTLIPVKSNRNQYRGVLGIMHNVSPRTTELEVLYPRTFQRLKDKTIWQPPRYYEDGEAHYMVWCPCCAEWQRRRSFYANVTRPNGLQGICKTCDNEKRAERRRRSRAA